MQYRVVALQFRVVACKTPQHTRSPPNNNTIHTQTYHQTIAHVPVEKLVPLVGVQQRSVEDVMDIPIPQVMWEFSR